MKNLKTILLSTVLTLGTLISVFVTSCNQDKCKNVVCANGGTCDINTGACVCASGYEGADCNTRVIVKYLGTYVGNGTSSPSGTYPGWKIVISQTDTTSTTNAVFTLKDNLDVTQISFTGTISSNGIINLNNHTTTNYIYDNGSGSIAVGTSANLTFRESDNPSGANPYIYTFNNMTKM